MSDRILITRQIPSAGIEKLQAAGFTCDVIEQDEPAPRAEVLRRVAGCAGVVAMLSDRVDEEFLAAAGDQLKIVANFAVGYDNIGLNACQAAGVRASNTPGVLTAATADLTWALILAAARRVVEADRFTRTGRWQGWAPQQYLGLELAGSTLGIVGAGRIGTEVALRSLGFSMKVIYSHPRQNEVLERWTGAELVELDELVARSEVVSLHVPLRPENRHLINAERLAQMKPHAILINTARGPVIDEAALVACLRERRIAGAGLDVFEEEPELAPGLAELDNVVVLPHLGSATHTTRSKMSAMVADNIIAVLSGNEPLHPIN
jgi:glyoxylate reductase